MPTEEWKEHDLHLAGEFSEHPDARSPWEWATVVATMYVGPGEVIDRETKEMTDAGVCPAPATDADATNLLHQRYHFWQWQKTNPDLNLSDMSTICEVGAGYGASVIAASRLGFRGNYHIADLQVMHRIREAHLPWRHVQCKVHRGLKRHCDLLLSICGLSEMGLGERDVFMRQVQPTSWLLGYMSGWAGVDNDVFFGAWARKQAEERGIPSRVIEGAGGNHLTYLTSYRVWK